MHRGEVVQLDRVADELWEGEGPQNARNAVHVVASRLRAALGDELVRSEGGGYRLAPGRSTPVASRRGTGAAARSWPG